MTPRQERLEIGLKAAKFAGVVAMLYGVGRLALAWMATQAGKSGLGIFAAALISALEVFAVGLAILIVAIVGQAAVRSHASKPARGARE